MHQAQIWLVSFPVFQIMHIAKAFRLSTKQTFISLTSFYSHLSSIWKTKANIRKLVWNKENAFHKRHWKLAILYFCQIYTIQNKIITQDKKLYHQISSQDNICFFPNIPKYSAIIVLSKARFIIDLKLRIQLLFKFFKGGKHI